MAKTNLSMKDIADNCGTSVTTVSFVVNGLGEEKNISPAVIAKIQQYIAKVGYRPHAMAKGLRTGKSKTIGFLVDDISEPFFSGIAKYVDEKAAESGYKIIFCCTGNDPLKTAELLDMLANRHMDGYIIAMAEGLEEQILPFLASDVPMVLFDRYIPDLNADQITVDNYESVYKATIHLIENGYTKIAYLNPITTQQQMIDRRMGYLDAIQAHALPSHVVDLPTPLAQNKEIEALLKSDQIDAMIFSANYITMQAIRTMMDLDRKLFEQFGMVSFDDLELFKFLPVTITAIAQPIPQIAAEIMEVMLKRLNGSATKEKIQKVVQTQLIVRASSQKK